jgi:FkbM family methyltransferase
MMTPRHNYNPVLTEFLIKKGIFKNDPLFYVDVGCSGGISEHLPRIWGQSFRGLGFDPLISEIQRLKKENKHSGIEYIDAFIGCSDDKPKFYDETDCPPGKDFNLATDFLERSTALKAQELTRTNYAQEYFNKGQEIIHSTRTVSLDEFLKLDDKRHVNFIKTDTDGFDYLVLMGAEEILQSPNLLGLFVEVSFQRKIWRADNAFNLVDRFVRKFGFSLYDMEIYRYARAALPSPFYYNIPAQTKTGQVNWGDVLYFRDYARPDYENHWFKPSSTTAILKQACLFEMCGLQDCAAELLIKYKDKVEELVQLKSLLDLLAPDGRTYDEHLALFEKYVKEKNWTGFQ